MKYTSDEQIDTYVNWQKAQNIPIHGGFFIEDLSEVELAPWDWKGGLGAFVNLEGTGGSNDGYVCEIPPGRHLKPQKHLYEEMVFILDGRGATSVWQSNGRKHTFEWHPGSLFAIPLNASYQHFNGQGDAPVKYFGVTNAPFMLNLFHNLDFIFENDFAFTSRFSPEEEDYFSGRGHIWGEHKKRTSVNFVSNTYELQLYEWKERGAGGKHINFDMAGNVMGAHISEFPVGRYKKAHRHGPGAHVVILSGQGYSLLWPEGGNRVRVDWKPRSVVVPPNQWFHQHFNSGAEPARYLALRWNSWRYRFVVLSSDAPNDVSLKQGGTQIEYEDEDREIHEIFEARLARAGARCRMESMVPWCTQRE
ncbi:MAG: ethanolamine ammonia lyase-activating protein [Deltaproteobacteria bacterium]|nr:ethanolamine ammonia lyase-activating protein [Deltaproteobacteria bacterium]